MMRSVYLKTLYDKRIFMLGWTLGFAVLAALMVSFFPAMRQDGTIDALVANMPDAFQGLIGDLALLTSFDTCLAAQLFDIRMPLIAGIMAIVLGLGLSVTDEEKGELRTILSLPVGRTKLLFEKWFAMVTIMAVTLVGLVVGIYLTMPFIEGAEITNEALLRLVGMTGLVMVTFGTIPFAIGMASGRRGMATSLSVLAVIGSFLLTTFGAMVEWLADFERLSLLHYFPATDIVRSGAEASDIAVLGGLTSGLLLVAYLRFRSRDVA